MTTSAITNAVLLAAGLGERLRPLTLTLPKPLLPLNGTTAIDEALHFLRRGGIEHVVVNLHHLGDKIKAHVGGGQRYRLTIRYSEEPTILGTGGGIKQAAARFGNTTFVVLNGVVLIDCDVRTVIAHHFKMGADATMVLRAHERNDRFTSVAVDAHGWITDFGGTGHHFYTGLQIVGPTLYQQLPPAGKKSCLIENGCRPLLAAGGRIAAFIHDGYWNKVETSERYEQIKKDITAGKIVLR